jgi:hypothetical protein
VKPNGGFERRSQHQACPVIKGEKVWRDAPRAAAPWRRSVCCAVLCCAVLCCAVLCCAVLCCAVLCCAWCRSGVVVRE